MIAARMQAAIIYGWPTIRGPEASYICHTGDCVHPMHVLLESATINAMRTRCHTRWDVCEHIILCKNLKPLNL